MKRSPRLLAAISGAALLLLPPLFGQHIQFDEEPLWSVSPQERDYLTTEYAEKGLAYNPTNHRLYLTSYHPQAHEFSIHILDAEDGSDLGQLSTEGISGGTQALRKIIVSDDGIIYAANLTTNSRNDPFKIYRWDDESADPVLVFEGDPSGGDAGVHAGYGGSLSIRGTGNDTQILAVPDYWQQNVEPHVTAVFHTADGGNWFNPTSIKTEPTTRYGLGSAFGEGETFWGTRAGQPLREFDFDGNLLREFGSSVVVLGLSPFDIDLESGLLAGINVSQIYVYNLATLSPENYNTPVAVRPFPTSNENVERTGEVTFGDGVIYALDTNNGIVAYAFHEEPPPPPGDLYWTTANSIRTMNLDGSNLRTVLTDLSRPIGIDIDPVNEFLYWAEDALSAVGAGRIVRANLDGSDVTPLLTERTTPQFLRFNPKNERLYWAEYSTGLYSMATDGSDLRHLLDLQSKQTAGVELDLENDLVYVATAGGELYRYEIGSAYPATPAPIASIQTQTYSIALDSASDSLWATSFTLHKVYSIDLNNLNHTDVVTSGLSNPLGIALSHDGSQMVWVERAGGRIRIANVGENSYDTIIEDENSPFGILFRPSAPTEGTDFESWIAQFDLPEGQDGATDDPDGDGISNLLEFALGLDPSAANRDGLPQIQTISENENLYLILEVEKNSSASGVELLVESSGDLENWNSGEGHTVVLEDSGSFLRVRDAVAVDEQNRRFLRLRATTE